MRRWASSSSSAPSFADQVRRLLRKSSPSQQAGLPAASRSSLGGSAGPAPRILRQIAVTSIGPESGSGPTPSFQSDSVASFFSALYDTESHASRIKTREQRAKDAEKRQLAQSQRLARRTRNRFVRTDRPERLRRVCLTEGGHSTIRDASHLLMVPMSRIVGVLRRLGERIPGRGSVAEVTIANEAIQLVATELNLSFEVDLRAPDIDKDDERFIQSRYAADADPSTWPRRPVVVSLVGHVDHGKTTLLDALRCSRLASGEVGGITQRIGAFALRLSDEAWATVLDTPGHGAFMTMRANACRLTDVVVLVVAADASVQAQTIASIQAIQAEHLPMVVALTKCDLPGADLDRVRRDLLDHGVMCESLGGDVQMVPVSAVNNHGLEALKEAIALAGEMAEPAAPRHGPARAVVIDSYVERGRGTMISAMVRRGTLRIGDVVLAGPCFGVVKSMYDDAGRAVREATPAQAVQLSGLKESPDPGSDMIVVDTEQRARRMASRRIWLQEQQQLANTPLWKASEASSSPGTVTESVASVRKCLRMIVRADLAGSVTALSEFIASLPQDKVQLQIMSQAVGNITEQDLDLAKQAGATIFGFNVTLSGALKKIARSAEIDVKTQKIIYKMMDSIIESINLLMPSNQVIESVGRAEIATMFDLKGNRGKVSHRVAGCRVLAGAMKRSARVRLIRSGSTVWEGAMHSLKHFKDDVPTVEKGSECGIVLEGFDDLKQGDVIECFQHKHVQEKLVYRPSDSFTQRTAHQY